MGLPWFTVQRLSMRVSVVTVCFNASETIENTLASVAAQTHPDVEHIIVDGGSKDDTLAIVARFPHVARVISESDKGVFDAMNKGLSLFAGDAVGFLNADDTFHDAGALEAIAAGLMNADIAFGDLLMVADHRSKAVVREWRAGQYAPGAFQRGWQPPHPGFFVRRAVAERTGPFDLSYLTASDYDYMLRALALDGVRVSYVPRVIADFQMGGVSTRDWRATLRGTMETLRSRREHLNAPPVDAALFLRLIRRVFQMRKLSGYYGK